MNVAAQVPTAGRQLVLEDGDDKMDSGDEDSKVEERGHELT
jgi:hypothetical protein